ncbi:hypothetical protein BH09BAC3_BH09BAC3_07040 [soil metagenome]
MYVIESATNQIKVVEIRALDQADLKKITKSEYFFNWRTAAKESEVYKLTLIGEEDILGLVGLVHIPSEQRVEVKLLASSIKNVGKNKLYKRIPSCMIAFACKEALTKYGDLACVSLLPKTELKAYYIKEFGMRDGGRQVYLEGIELLDLIKKFI